MDEKSSNTHGVQITAHLSPEYAEILSAPALELFSGLVRRFAARRDELIMRRSLRQQAFDRGEKPDFLSGTAAVRKGDWTVAPIPADLQDRRVEITGPAGDRKMVINALNSGAKTFMADFEDANSPTWDNTVGGQVNLRDAVRRTITYKSPDGRLYSLEGTPAVLIVRPRGWHLDEKHVLVDGRPAPAGLFDFSLYAFHNARYLLDHGSGPYFYLPKLESHLEARLWNDVFLAAEEDLGLPPGSIKATVLIETVVGAFEADEILYELRDHAVGLNCGRWDYIFSYIKKFRNDPGAVLPDRSEVTMTVPFMRAYSRYVIQVCHRRRAHAMGGMAAQIPIRNDPEANAVALEKVRQDKEREVSDGHDGTWVAHPALVPVAMEVFDRWMPTANQIDRKLADFQVTAADLLEPPVGNITAKGVQTNAIVALHYLAAWLSGRGAVPIFHLMEDAATAEISRAQLWQWVHSEKGVLDDGRKVTSEMVEDALTEELNRIRREGLAGENGNEEMDSFLRAAELLRDLVNREEFVDFLTIPAYALLP